MNKVAVLAIDVQNDFMDIPSAALPVTGAVKDTERIADLIKKVNPQTIFASQDSHYTLDIAHTGWWKDAKGNTLSPFTMVTSADIESGKYIPIIDPKRSLDYIKKLEANGEYVHILWPDHCLMGTEGHAFHPTFFTAIQEWMHKTKRWANFIVKGVNPHTEHFGIFRANVPLQEDPNTQVNQGIFATLNNHDVIYLVGQARSHCVANSLKQMLSIAPQLASKLTILTDCMSDVQGLPSDFYVSVDNIYKDAEKAGVTLTTSTNI